MNESARLIGMALVTILSFPIGILCGWKIHKYREEEKLEQRRELVREVRRMANPDDYTKPGYSNYTKPGYSNYTKPGYDDDLDCCDGFPEEDDIIVRR